MECVLEESLEISTVLNSKDKYLEWLKQDSPISIDASQVVRVDTAGLQTLASLFNSAKRAGLDISMTNTSSVLTDAIVLLNLEKQFYSEKEL
ncbi:STAS domain-containing protein [Vibrio sp. T187]|uniref:STAS domain-containing protein n=1 Tax=Vibrio TaxID=662 RepID=UPI0010CA1013|nr:MULTISPECIES: STAS domain-containing protein [Vibrio]MBW3695241.1 STAS domain-containing protein [Vibrio sp. T187]